MSQVIGRGAEAVLYLKENLLVKERIKKGYRIQELDEKIRSQRTKAESRIMVRARRHGINVPQIKETKKYKISMEFIDGERLKEFLNQTTSSKRKKLAKEIGLLVAKLHSSNIIHGDLTTSNMILFEDKIYLIDFGLAFHSQSIEDQAVDLHLLHQAYQSTHFEFLDELWNPTIEAYKENFKNSKKVLKRLEKIRKRGRYSKR